MRWASIGDRLELTVPAHARVLRPLRSTLDRWLQARGANETESFEILVAVGEACANAIQHAGVTQFQVRAEGETDLVLSVTDGGDWRPPVALAGGQGLAIMERFMDRVDRRSGPAGTAVTMRRRLGQARVAEGTP